MGCFLSLQLGWKGHEYPSYLKEDLSWAAPNAAEKQVVLFFFPSLLFSFGITHGKPTFAKVVVSVHSSSLRVKWPTSGRAHFPTMNWNGVG
jgi:hypothetical protein